MHNSLCNTQDTEENRRKYARKDDLRVVYTVVIKLSRGGTTSMRIIGEEALDYKETPGTGVCFLSDLWHRTEMASQGTTKLTIFFGVRL